MLSVASVKSAAGAAEYLGKDNYYLSETEAEDASSWEGKGAKALGLEGKVTKDRLQAVLEGRLPDGQRVGTPDTHRPGTDPTFSAPKSVSLLALVGGDTRLVDAHREAVRKTLAWAESRLAETRRTIDGTYGTEKTGNLVVATVVHDTSRKLDPQLHTHAVVANVTQGTDGKWRALKNDRLWAENKLLGAIYHTLLARAVERLGYVIGETGKNGTFEIAGLSRDQILAFSQRSLEIRQLWKEFTYQTDSTRTLATLITRPTKERVDRDWLRRQWSERATALGLDLAGMVRAARDRIAAPQQGGFFPGMDPRLWARKVEGWARGFAETLGQAFAPKDPFGPRPMERFRNATEVAEATAVGAAIRHLKEREAAFRSTDVLKTALGFGLPVTVDGVERRIDQLVERGVLARGQGTAAELLTTRDGVQEERQLLHATAAGERQGQPVLDADRAAAAVAGTRLNPGQRAAATLILASPDRVVAVQGVAGSGKSTMLRETARIAEAEGRSVLGLAHTNKVVRDLADGARVEAMTVTRFLRSRGWLLAPNVSATQLTRARLEFKHTLLVVDEASQLSTHQKLQLIRLANRLDIARVALVGDTRQLGAIDAGKPFDLLQRTGTPTAEMSENLRQRHARMREAAQLARDGKPGAALKALKQDVTETANPVRDAVARWAAMDPARGADTLILAGSRRQRAELNTAVQQVRQTRGELGTDGTVLSVRDRIGLTREEERQLASYRTGMHIQFDRDLPSQKIASGTVGEVVAVDRPNRTVILRTEDGRTIAFRPDRLATNRTENSLYAFTPRDVTVHVGDRIRWTNNDRERGLWNADGATVLAVDTAGLTIRNKAGDVHRIGRDDPMAKRLDLDYARTVHSAQGDDRSAVIGVLDASERTLNTQRLFYVEITRQRDELSLFLDNRDSITRQLESQPGDKTSALETLGALAGRRAPGQAATPAATSGAIDPLTTPTSTAPQPAERVRDRIRDFSI